MNATTELEIKAHHESGHAIAHHVAGILVELLEIDRCVLSHEYQQKLNEEQITEIVKRETLLQHLIGCCAGKASVDRYGWKAATDENWKASNDYAQAFECALQLSDDDPMAARLLVAYAERMAELLVEKQWPQISRLANALLERDKINGNEITHIMQSRGPSQRV